MDSLAPSFLGELSPLPFLIGMGIGLIFSLIVGYMAGSRAGVLTFLAFGLLLGIPGAWTLLNRDQDSRTAWQQSCFGKIRSMESAVELYNIDHATAPIELVEGPFPHPLLTAGKYLPGPCSCGEFPRRPTIDPGTYSVVLSPPASDSEAVEGVPRAWHVRCSLHGHPEAPLPVGP